MKRADLTKDEMMQLAACLSSSMGDIRTLSFFSDIDWIETWTGLLTANDDFIYADIKRQMMVEQLQEMAQPELYV